MLYKKVVKVKRLSDSVMEVVLAFDVDVLRLICGYGLQSGEICKNNSVFIIS